MNISMSESNNQARFSFLDDLASRKEISAGDASPISSSANSVNSQDRMIHEWYRFVLSYPPHLVRDYLKDFDLPKRGVILDPFCGTGTTLVEAQLNGFNATGLEANPFPAFASRVKTDWTVNPDNLEARFHEIADKTTQKLLTEGFDDRGLGARPNSNLRRLPAQAERALINNSISPIPLHKALTLLEEINKYNDTPEHKYLLLALAKALVTSIGNLKFGPEVGIGKIKVDVPVVGSWQVEIKRTISDLRQLRAADYPQATVHLADARQAAAILAPTSIDAVITSPPYPNEKDYTRTTRLESVILGFYQDMPQIRQFKKDLIRSNTRSVYVTDGDDRWVEKNTKIQAIAKEIEDRRVALGKSSGFEKLYPRITKLYFGGMARHLTELTHILRPNAQLAYVVGDQASYLQVMIRTGELLGEIAEEIGYEVIRIDLFRTRFATATQEDLREEVLVLKWKGPKKKM
jgi:DNA modification methylase